MLAWSAAVAVVLLAGAELHAVDELDDVVVGIARSLDELMSGRAIFRGVVRGRDRGGVK